MLKDLDDFFFFKDISFQPNVRSVIDLQCNGRNMFTKTLNIAEIYQCFK